MEGLIIQALGVQRDLSNGISELSLSEHENALLLQYKDLIRDQDKKLQEWQRKYAFLEKQFDEAKGQMDELQQTYTQLKDQNTLLKAQLSTGAAAQQAQAPLQESAITAVNNDDLMERLQTAEAEVARLRRVEEELAEKTAELESYQKDQDDLLELLTAQDTKLNKFKERLRQFGALPNEEDSSSDVSDNERERDSRPSLL